jgi:2,5-diamino-6-(ribosylamino)-4(3H)-pyrimidinone 5'-phosphate reductase
MVEGGAQVIESFLAESSKGVIDTVIVTVAPTFVGVDGVGYAAPLGMLSGFQHIRTEIKGKDAVVAMIPTSEHWIVR